MNRQSLKNPVVATFLWALGVNLILWFYINVIWLGSEDRKFFGRVVHAYTTPFNFIPGIFIPLFVGLITALLVFIIRKVRQSSRINSLVKWISYAIISTMYIPVSLLGSAAILTVA